LLFDARGPRLLSDTAGPSAFARVGFRVSGGRLQYSKPYLTLLQQVRHLAGYGLIVGDEAWAEHCLARVGYYRLSAYWYPFRKSVTHIDPATGQDSTTVLSAFKGGTNFDTIMALYVFDKKLRMIVLDALERVEVAIRTDIALLLGQVSPVAHRDPNALDGKFARLPNPRRPATTLHAEWLSNIDDKARRSKEDFVKHFDRTYQGDLPIWMSTELWDFGALSMFYSGMKTKDRDFIAAQYGQLTGREFSTWLRCLNDVRNVCAHHSRLWNRPLSSAPRWPTLGRMPALDQLSPPQANHRLYAAIIVLHTLLRRINPTSQWTERLATHLETFPQNGACDLSSAGFPQNWERAFGL